MGGEGNEDWVQFAAMAASAYGASQKSGGGGGAAPAQPNESGHVNVGGFNVPEYNFNNNDGLVNIAGTNITSSVITGVITALIVAFVIKKMT